MSQTAAFIARLGRKVIIGPAEQAEFRALAGRSLDHSVNDFDLFTGLWWPLREKSATAPRREVAWLVAKLYSAFPIPHAPCVRDGPSTLASILGREEIRIRPDSVRQRFRQRFDSLLCAPLTDLEPHLRWALAVVRDATADRRISGVDWVQLTDHISIWDRGPEHGLGRDIREIWAEQYWEFANKRKEPNYADRNSHDSKP